MERPQSEVFARFACSLESESCSLNRKPARILKRSRSHASIPAGSPLRHSQSSSSSVISDFKCFRDQALESVTCVAFHPLATFRKASGLTDSPLGIFARLANKAIDKLPGANLHEHGLKHLEEQFSSIHNIVERLQALEEALDADDLPLVLSILRAQLDRNVGNMCNQALSTEPGTETEKLIDYYQGTVAAALDRIVEACEQNDSRLSRTKIREELRGLREAYGRSALLCSGGGTLGMAHIGVIKALLEAHCLPRIVSGSSSGAIVCSVLCTKYVCCLY